jgi:hypothetical protein
VLDGALDAIRKQAETTDTLEGVQLTHSVSDPIVVGVCLLLLLLLCCVLQCYQLGGGTGSGVGALVSLHSLHHICVFAELFVVT